MRRGGKGRPSYALMVPDRVAAELARRWHRRDELQADDEGLHVAKDGLSIATDADGPTVAALKRHWRGGGPECPICSGPRLAILQDNPRRRLTVCITCPARFVERRTKRGWRFHHRELRGAGPADPTPSAAPDVARAVPSPPHQHRTPSKVGAEIMLVRRRVEGVVVPMCGGRLSARADGMRRHQIGRLLADAWLHRDVDGLRDHVTSAGYESNILELRVRPNVGLSVALLKRLWRHEPAPAKCPCGGERAAVTLHEVHAPGLGARLVAGRRCMSCHRTSADACRVPADVVRGWAREVRRRGRRWLQ